MRGGWAPPGRDVEVIVVSDGSIDGTAERLLEARSDDERRVIHYDRNLGKGYAVRLGALAARGDWIALVDADLDLDPSRRSPRSSMLRARERLDIALGSKRHPGLGRPLPSLPARHELVLSAAEPRPLRA